MTRSDEELMVAYAAGEDPAVAELFRRYAPILLGLVRRRLGGAADAKDVVQQTFLQLHRARRDFRREMRFRPWIMTIALNLARDLLRRRGRHPESEIDEERLPAPEHEPDDADGASERSVRMQSALRRIPRQQREVIELHWFERLPFEEVARVIGITSGAARVRAHRGYVSLRRVLAEG
jgi:RNA polymerase sigma-70 factor (ECF subfamily)